MAGFGTLHEVKTQWSIDDVADAHEVLTLKENAERKAIAEAQKGQGRR